MSTDAGGRLFVLGLVGRAGSGKSTVARALAADGAALIEADRLGHAVTDGDPEVRAALMREYGNDIYGADGALDRRRVATAVFADPAARRRLDQLVHPRILARIRERVAETRRTRVARLVVIDAALMLEWGLERECDAVIAVIAPEDTQIARLTASRGWSYDEARARLAAQRSNESFAAAADVTLDNRGSEDDLIRAAREAVARLNAPGSARGSATEG